MSYYIVIILEQFEDGCFIIHKIVVYKLCVCSQNARLACLASTAAEHATVNTACHVTASAASVSARLATPGTSAQTVSIHSRCLLLKENISRCEDLDDSLLCRLLHTNIGTRVFVVAPTVCNMLLSSVR